jgi:hypothetical protein
MNRINGRTIRNSTVVVALCMRSLITTSADAFGAEAGEDEVWEALRPLLASPAFISGGAACCLCYGQTASGKTFTAATLAIAAAQDLLVRFPGGGLKVRALFALCSLLFRS